MRFDKLTTKFQQALADAQSLAVRHDHPYIENAHLLAALLAPLFGASVGLGLIGYAIYRKNKRDNAALEAKSQQIAQRRRATTTVDETSDIGSDT